MGSSTDARIRAWQEAAGIEPAGPELRDAFERLTKAAHELIAAVPLEVSGIRDGDGHWHGADVIGAVLDNIGSACCAVRSARGEPRDSLECNQEGKHR